MLPFSPKSSRRSRVRGRLRAFALTLALSLVVAAGSAVAGPAGGGGGGGDQSEGNTPAAQCVNDGGTWVPAQGNSQSNGTCNLPDAPPPPPPAVSCELPHVVNDAGDGCEFVGEACNTPALSSNPHCAPVLCANQGGTWTGGQCVHPPTPEEECDASGGAWTDGECIYPPTPEEECEADGGTWDAGQCIPPAPQPTAGVRPVLENGGRSTLNCDGTYTATFGYLNENEMSVTIPHGAGNSLTGSVTSGSTVTEFASGRHFNVFEVTFSGGNVVWTLTSPNGSTRTSTAGTNNPIVAECEPVPTEPVSPVLENGGRSTLNCDGTYTATFGYNNRNSITVTIPHGSDNRLTGNVISGTTVTEFAPGRQVGVFEVTFSGGNVVWTLVGPDGRGRTSTAGTNNPIVAECDDTAGEIDGPGEGDDCPTGYVEVPDVGCVPDEGDGDTGGPDDSGDTATGGETEGPETGTEDDDTAPGADETTGGGEAVLGVEAAPIGDGGGYDGCEGDCPGPEGEVAGIDDAVAGEADGPVRELPFTGRNEVAMGTIGGLLLLLGMALHMTGLRQARAATE